jgi:hypothetical protein
MVDSPVTTPPTELTAELNPLGCITTRTTREATMPHMMISVTDLSIGRTSSFKNDVMGDEQDDDDAQDPGECWPVGNMLHQ